MQKEIQTAIVNRKGQVTIPFKIRAALGIKPKDRLLLEVVNNELRIKRSLIADGFGALKPIKPLKGPIDFRKLRREIEEEIAQEVIKET